MKERTLVFCRTLSDLWNAHQKTEMTQKQEETGMGVGGQMEGEE